MKERQKMQLRPLSLKSEKHVSLAIPADNEKELR